jgi:hypothetical protein
LHEPTFAFWQLCIAESSTSARVPRDAASQPVGLGAAAHAPPMFRYTAAGAGLLRHVDLALSFKDRKRKTHDQKAVAAFATE